MCVLWVCCVFDVVLWCAVWVWVCMVRPHSRLHAVRHKTHSGLILNLKVMLGCDDCVYVLFTHA